MFQCPCFSVPRLIIWVAIVYFRFEGLIRHFQNIYFRFKGRMVK